MSGSDSGAAEQRLRTAIEAAPSGILMSDGEGRIVLVNQQVETLFGYAREELLGKPVEMLVPEEIREAHRGYRASFLKELRVRSMGLGRELHGLRHDGTRIPLEITLTPVVTGDGIFVLSSIVDLSARKRAESRFRIAVESSPSGMVMIDRDGRMVLVNQEIERMFGYMRDEMLERPIEMLVPERFRGTHPQRRAAFYAQPEARPMGGGRELFGLRRDGTEFPIEIGLNPIETEDGLLVLASVVDISGRKRAEQDRRRLEAQLQEAQKLEAIGRLASGISHDFNNLLMGILGCGTLARRSLADDHEAVQALDDICAAARRGAALTRDLLDFARHRPVERSPSRLNAVVRIAERMLRQVIGEDIAIEVELCPADEEILANPTHVEHVLLNLAVNARDAMPEGGRLRIATLTLDLDAPLATRNRRLPAGRYIVLEVEDSGTGMDEATQARLFEPFFTTKAPGSGTGLGLHTVHSIVEQLEGGIELESRVGHGTRFRVYFPRHESAVPALAPAEVRPSSPRIPSGGGRARILVLEDDRLIRATLRHLLTGLGHEVLVAETGRQAVETARTSGESLDLLLSDIVLPDTTGTDVAKILVEARPTLRVLFMSAYPTHLLVQQGRITPGTKTLEKPFDELALATAVREALGVRQA